MEKSKAGDPLREDGKHSGKLKGGGSVLLIAALDMSWRLAIAVLVPIIGGFELDKHWNIAPALTIVGFLLAMVGVFVIMKRTVANADERFKSTGVRR